MEALSQIKRGRFDLVLSDLKMPRMDGIKLIGEIRAAGCDTPIIMMTAHASVQTAVEAMKVGAYDYIQKPFVPLLTIYGSSVGLWVRGGPC